MLAGGHRGAKNIDNNPPPRLRRDGVLNVTPKGSKKNLKFKKKIYNNLKKLK